MSGKTNHVNLNLGTSSLLLIFVVLSLVSFAVLSLSSALSDKKLTDKTVEKNVSYYEACNEAYEKLADLDKKLIDIYKTSSDEASYLKACEELDLEMIIPVTEYQGLEVKVTPNYPTSDNDVFYSITVWKLIHTSEPKLDFSINVMK
jgi:hypothetical protein